VAERAIGRRQGMVVTSDIEELGFDPDALRARYRAERDKRLRPDGIRQFVEPTG
jgi:hypothetical protein